MSIKIMTRVWDTRCESHTEKLVLMALADNANDDDGECWPGMGTLARKCDLTPQGVRNWIKKLEEKGWLAVDRSQSRNPSNVYRITIPIPPNAVDTTKPETPVRLTDLLGSLVREFRNQGNFLDKRLPNIVDAARAEYRLRSGLMWDIAEILERIADNHK